LFGLNTTTYSVQNYDLDATLTSGQAFRWTKNDRQWEGIIGNRWMSLEKRGSQIIAHTPQPAGDWHWLEHYLQLKVDLSAIIRTFPQDPAMKEATRACHGLRLLRQSPWECLACFICSSTKQIVQIQQIVDLLCQRLGSPIESPSSGITHAFPTFTQLASVNETKLRECKMGFRAPYLLSAARTLVEGKLELDSLNAKPIEEARECLMTLDGVGPKIADCILLFAYGFPEAFPIDVWIKKALSTLYFRGRPVSAAKLNTFVSSHFGPHAGYAQQYLFHYMRTAKP